MRPHLSRYLRHLTAASILLLGSAGALISTTGWSLGASAACGCEVENSLGKLEASEQPVKFLGIGVAEKEHFDYKTFPEGGPESEEAKLGTTTIEQKKIAGKIGEWKFVVGKNECEGKTLKPGFSCLLEVIYEGEAEALEILEEPKKVCGRIVQPYKGVISGRGSQAVAKLDCEK
jgi:hypothetical protein